MIQQSKTNLIEQIRNANIQYRLGTPIIGDSEYDALIEEFRTLYDSAAALVINGYRQMAMGNIMSALAKGVKVYLSSKNCMYSWALNEGFKVFDVNDLAEDIENDNIYLAEEDMAHNKQVYSGLADKYSVQEFLRTIL